MSKQGSTLSGLLDTFAISVSMALQYGVPFREFARKFIYTRFEPAGFTENPSIKIATSIADYIFRYLSLRFLSADDLSEFGMLPAVDGDHIEMKELKTPVSVIANKPIESEAGATMYNKGQTAGDTVCKKCGGMMVRTGTCQTCFQCGSSSGGCS